MLEPKVEVNLRFITKGRCLYSFENYREYSQLTNLKQEIEKKGNVIESERLQDSGRLFQNQH